MKSETRQAAVAFLLGVMFLLGFIVNMGFAPIADVMERLSPRRPPLGLFVLMAVILVQPMILGTWLTMGMGTLKARVLQFSALATIMVLSWACGLAFWGDINERQLWEAYMFVCFVPIVVTCGAVPLWVTRAYGHVYLVTENSKHTQANISIGKLLLVVTCVAVVIAITQVGMGQFSRAHGGGGQSLALLLSCCFSLGVGFFVLLPSLFWLMRGGWWRFAVGAISLIAIGFACWSICFWGVSYLLNDNVGGGPPPRVQRGVWLNLGLVIAASQFFYFWFLGTLKLAGLSLMQAKKTHAFVAGSASVAE